ncbi:DLW-39 family protein [Nocardia sp. NBC_01327]|nr:DLW-39 family protein [Nocardia sp. NBC_01327]
MLKTLLMVGVVAAVIFGISKLRQRSDADLWHEVTTR